MRNKKSSLSLSINAIVILILAITMLGLGLTFMRGLFKQATEKVEAAVSAQELVNPPTIDSPLTIAPAEITLRGSKQGKTTIAFLNTGADGRSCTLSHGTRIGGATDVDLTHSGDAATMNTDQINTWTIGIDAGTTTGTALYTIIMTCGSDTYTKDIVVTVTS